MEKDNNEVHLPGVFLRQTEKAVLVRLRDDSEHWFPKSQLGDWSSDFSILSKGDECDVFTSEWLVGEKNLDLDRVEATE